ncbi:MAG: AAA family ATPase [Alphaproteobacteria bacterium]|nr:AAA family ATPase [Alphaproteobacteria bacterium]
MAQPTLIIVGGMAGCGKTTLAAALAKHFPNSVHLDSDRIRKEIFGVSETTRLPAEAYTTEAKSLVFDEINRRIEKYFAEGKTIIVSAAVLSPRTKTYREQLAAENNAVFAGIFLQADLHVLFDRVARRVDDVSDAGADVVRFQAASAADTGGWPVIDANQSPEAVFQAALKIIQQARAGAVKPRPRRQSGRDPGGSL